MNEIIKPYTTDIFNCIYNNVTTETSTNGTSTEKTSTQEKIKEFRNEFFPSCKSKL
uniref:Uncharacterized protein n=1 Tax=viral metagenome TaxID=1070528 RepID=A0A6C0J444_9ZZZZ